MKWSRERSRFSMGCSDRTCIFQPATGPREGYAATNDVVAWLLDGDAAMQLATRTRLLGEDADSRACRKLRAHVMWEGVVPAILATQRPDGHWAGRDRFYTASTPARCGA